MENVLQLIWQHILLELAAVVVEVVAEVAAEVAVGVAVGRNSLVEAVPAVANNKIASVVVAAAAAADSLPSFQDLPMVEAEEEPFPVEGGDNERWYWLVPWFYVAILLGRRKIRTHTRCVF